MSRDSKIATIISTGMVCLGILTFLWIFPFIYMYIGMVEQANTNIRDTKWDRLAIEHSIFRAQKIFTIENALPSLILAKDYYNVISYYKELEKYHVETKSMRYLVAYSYMQVGEYEDALKYAYDNEYQKAQIFINMKAYDKAKPIVSKLMSEKPIKPKAYLYKAELDMAENKWKEAETSIDKLLKINPNHLEGLQAKARVSKKLGRSDLYKKYMGLARLRQIQMEGRVN